MKQTLRNFLLVLSSMIVGQTAQADQLTLANKSAVLRFFEQFSNGNAKAAFALVAPDVKWWVPESLPFGGTYDRAGYVTRVLPQFAGFKSGLKLKVVSLIADGNRVAAEVESYGLHTCGDFIYNNKYHFLIEMRDGQFIEVKEYMDTRHLSDLYVVTQTETCKSLLRK